MKKYALIVAGGSGSRMQAQVPKQFLELNGRPVLMHTLEAFAQAGAEIELIVVLPAAWHGYWQELLTIYNFTIPHQVVAGGRSRFMSVKKGLAKTGKEGLIAIHDGVRPLVSPALINRCYQAARQHGSGVAAIEPKDSLRQLTSKGSRAVERQQYRLMQTPQTFAADLLHEVYRQANDDKKFTDDATVVGHYGRPVFLVEGEYRNLKITTPEDLVIAQALLVNK